MCVRTYASTYVRMYILITEDRIYLNNRRQNVYYNKADAKYMTITCGVPQGSIVGPLLFILYINDIENVSDILNPILFADDTSFFHAHTCFNKNLNMVPY